MSNTTICAPKTPLVQGLVHIQETDTQFNAQVPLPGFPKEAVTLLLEGSLLKVSAVRSTQVTSIDLDAPPVNKEVKGSARLLVPATANKELITATYSDGLLQITIPKKDEFILKTRKIEIL